jgi:hypothetical protein
MGKDINIVSEQAYNPDSTVTVVTLFTPQDDDGWGNMIAHLPFDVPVHVKTPIDERWYFNLKLHRLDGPAKTTPGRREEWFRNNYRHRTDGPAVVWADSSKQWYVEGLLHRLDGPAVEWADGHEEWSLEGKPHRTDGPAVTWTGGDVEWWNNGNVMSTKLYKETILQLASKTFGERMDNYPFSELESLVYAFNGWKL